MATSFQPLSDELDELLKSTARFVPAAFHIHSPDSHDWGKRQQADTARNATSRFADAAGLEAFLDELAAQFRFVCITDHMRSGFACRLAAASLLRDDIVVFPGMEINCIVSPAKERIHLLAVFPPNKDCIAIDRIFSSNKGFPTEPNRKGQEDFVVSGGLASWAEQIEQQEGILILAHIDDALRGHRAQFRAMRDESLSMFSTDTAGAIIDTQRQASEEYKTLVGECGASAIEIMNPEDRQHYVALKTRDGKTRRLPCVIRSDCHCVEDFAEPKKKTYVKVSTVSFEAMRDAIRFFDTRIKFKDDLLAAPAPRIVGLRLRSPTGNGLFEDAVIAFNENLNCIIGPRGCGKSTIMEALRYALGCNRALSDVARDSHAAVDYRDLALDIQQANLKDTIIEVMYEPRSGERHCLLTTYDQRASCSTEVYTISGDERPISHEAIAAEYPVSVYSWSEIENLGRQPELQRKLLDRLIERLPEYAQKREQLYRDLEENRQVTEAAVIALRNKLHEERGLLRRYREFKAEFELVNTPEVAALFEELDFAREKLGLLTAVRQEFVQLNHRFTQTTSLQIVDAISELLTNISENARKWWDIEVAPRLRIAEVADPLTALSAQITSRIADKIRSVDTAVKAGEKLVDEKETVLRERTHSSARDTLLRGKREQSKKRFEATDRKRTEYNALLQTARELLSKRAEIVQRIEELQDRVSGARSASRNAMMDRINKFQTPGREIQIRFESGRDRNAAVEYMRDGAFLSGQGFGHYREGRFAERCCAMAPPTKIARAILSKDVSPLTADGIPLDSDGALGSEEANSLISHFYPFGHDNDADVDTVNGDNLQRVLALEEQPWDDDLRILLNDRPVDKLSPGQRSSAMLPIVALSETVPLLIDQPEDNLDNRMVGTVLTRILAELKEHRQIIVATHNPNIVVGGDAEQVIVLDATGAHSAAVVQMGSIDLPTIIGSVISIMEGGADAFRARERRYHGLLEAS